ncbi:MAG: ATP-binding protein, partial [Myxococcales bacterium]|nr:ATP-binding protein [Myxococcales bacterium]
MPELETAGVDHEGLMQVLAHNLYSTPEVALRELVQNAHDSCTRRRLEDPDAPSPVIHVRADSEARTLSIRDNGAGLTHDEIGRYLATIGGGYTRVLRQEHDDEGLIGAFGLGFLSAYVVADRVEVHTTSVHTPDVGHVFRSRDGLRFTVSEGPPGPVGTEVVLHVKRAHASLSEPRRVRDLLDRYACLLTVPIHAPDLVNAKAPCWRADLEAMPPHAARAEVYRTAGAFEARHEVLAAFPLLAPDGVEAGGVLWVHDGATWATSDQRGVTVYVRGMLVSRDARELLPVWAGFAGAAIESDALVPTASREDLQRDHRWTAIQEAVRATLVQGFQRLASEEPHVWRRVLRRHNESLLGAALSDVTLFGLLRDELEVPTSEGAMTLPEVARRGGGRVAVSVGDDSGYEVLLHRAAGRPVVDGSRFGAAAFATRWCDVSGHPALVLGTRNADASVFPEVVVPGALRARLDGLFGEEDVAVVPSRFEPRVVPL